MNECYEYIEEIYKDNKVNELIKKIKPVDLQCELKQELALLLLEYNCDKLILIRKDGKLVHFVMRIIWNMSNLPNTKFYREFKKNNNKHIIEFNMLSIGENIPEEYITEAISILNIKMTKTSKDAHESIIFQKYVELQSCQKVANYFGIPRLHVFQVVNNVKSELKKKIRK